MTTWLEKLPVPKELSHKTIVWKSLKIAVLCAIIAASALSARFMIQVVPFVSDTVIPYALSKWPDHESVIFSKDGMNTQSGKPITLTFTKDATIVFDPTVNDVSFAAFKDISADILITHSFLFTREKNDQIKVMPLSEFTKDLDQPLIINEITILTFFKESFEYVPAAAGVIFVSSLFALSFHYFLSLIVASIIIALILFLIGTYILKKPISWSEGFYASIELGTWGVLLATLTTALFAPLSGAIFIPTCLLVLNWLLRK